MTNKTLEELRAMSERVATTGAMGWIVRSLAVGGESLSASVHFAEEARAPEAALRVLKAAVAAGSTATLDDLAGSGAVFSSWAATLAASSVFARMATDGAFLRTPFNKRFGAASAALPASVIDEGAPMPLRALQLAGDVLAPVKVGALLVLTDETWRDASVNGLALVNRLLRDAIAKAVDEKFFALVANGAPLTFTADGDDLGALREGLRKALGAVHTKAGGRLYWAASPQAANLMAAFSETGAGAMDPFGGFLLGLPVVITDGLSGSTVALVDAAGIAAELDRISFDRSTGGSVQFLDDPTNDAVDATATNTVSLYQSHSTAVRAVLSFAAARTRDGVLATVNIAVT